MTWTAGYLAKAGLDDPRLSSELLLAHALSCRKIELYTRFDQVPGDEQRAAFRELVLRAAGHEPIAYLVGFKEFYSLAFEVTPDVLIPRPETEALVDRMIACCRGCGNPANFVDVGTGSGCVAVAVLSQVDSARAVATEVSPAALAVAGRNAERHGVTDRLTLIEADRLDVPAELVPEGGFDLIVSNPPYIAEGDLAQLPANVRDYEPRIALAADADGLGFYRTFAESGPRLLRPGGSVLVEIAAGMGPAVIEVFAAAGRFEHIGTWRDPADPHDRVMQFRVA